MNFVLNATRIFFFQILGFLWGDFYQASIHAFDRGTEVCTGVNNWRCDGCAR